MRRSTITSIARIFVALLLAIPISFLHAADALTWQQKEEFLTKAKITKTKDAKKGVTGTFQVTLSDGTLTHDASVQTIDESKPTVSERSRI